MSTKKPIPPKRAHDTAKGRREEALARLKNNFERDHDGETFDPSDQPIITPLLKSAEGGIPKILEALRAHDDDDARGFIDLYDSLSIPDRRYLSLEEIATAAGIGSLRLGEIAQSAMILHGQLTTKLLLASSINKVVKASIKQAVTARGVADREMMLKAGGVLPVPKGAQIAIQTNITPDKSETKQLESAPEPVYLDSGQRLRMIHEAVEQRRLPAPKSDPVDVGGPLDKMQREAAEIISGDDDVQ
jgi:hypothetical protein